YYVENMVFLQAEQLFPWLFGSLRRRGLKFLQSAQCLAPIISVPLGENGRIQIAEERQDVLPQISSHILKLLIGELGHQLCISFVRKFVLAGPCRFSGIEVFVL